MRPAGRVIALVCLLGAASVTAAQGLITGRIQIDGDLSDWQAVLANPPNVVSDAPWFGADPDSQVDGYRDLLRFAVTWDDLNLYLYYRRSASAVNARKVRPLAYIDLDYDGRMGPDDGLLGLRYKTESSREVGWFDYVPFAATDPMPGDGGDVAGAGGALRSGDIEADVERVSYLEGEASIPWARLGVAPGSPLKIQPALSWVVDNARDLFEGVRLLPDGVDDNGNVLDTGFTTLELSPGTTVATRQDTTVSLTHVLTLGGNLTRTVDLAWTLVGAAEVQLYTDPDADGDPSDGELLAIDSDGDGSFIGPGDFLGPDSNGDLRPDVLLAAPQELGLVARVVIPIDQAIPSQLRLILTAEYAGGPAVSSVDVVKVHRLAVLPDHNVFAQAGSEVLLDHTICNQHESARDLSLEIGSDLGWPVSLLSAGLPVTRVSVESAACAEVQALVSVPPLAGAGVADVVSVTARMSSPLEVATASDTIRVASAVSLTPDASAIALAGSSVMYSHTLQNASGADHAFDFSYSDLFASETNLWTDPNGDGVPDDGKLTTFSETLDGAGESLGLVLQVDVPAGMAPGDELVSMLTATARADTDLVASVTDTTSVRLITSHAEPPPSPVIDGFHGCSHLYVRSGPLAGLPTRFKWFDAGGLLVQVSVPRLPSGGLAEDDLQLLDSDPAGVWRVQLEQDDGGGWLGVDPGGEIELSVLRELRPGAGIVAELTSDALEYPLTGASMSLTAMLTNTSALTFDQSTVDYLIYRDVDADAAPGPGDTYMDLGGSVVDWRPGARTCRQGRLPTIVSGAGHTETRCRDVGPMDFGASGGWLIQAHWYTSCGDTIAERQVGFNVGCTPTATAFAGAPRVVCAGEATQLGGGAALPGLGYRWSPSDYLDDPTSAEPWSTPASEIEYTLNVTDPGGCVSRDEVRLLVGPTPVADAGASTSICSGESLRLGAPGVAGLSYAWEPATGLDDASAADPLATPSDTTAYTLTVTDSSLSCEGSRTVVIDVHPVPLADAGPDRPSPSSIGPPVCDAELVYRWSPAADLDNPAACNPTASPATTTLYCLTVSDPLSGCDSSPECVSVGSGACPATPEAGPDGEGPVEIGPASCDPSFDYLWTPSEGLDDPSACRPLADPDSDRIYCLQLRDPISGCLGLADCVSVTAADSCPVVPEAVSRLRAIAASGDVELLWDTAADAAGGYHIYRWSSLAAMESAPGARVVDTAPDPLVTSGVDGGAVAGASNDPFYVYRVLGVCGDGTTEGPF